MEYGDYECPHCGHAYPIVKVLQKKFGKQLRFAFRNFLLREIHPYAEAATETAEFAATHGTFWEVHDLIPSRDLTYCRSSAATHFSGLSAPLCVLEVG